MVFSSLEFLTIFLPAVLLLYFIFPQKLKNPILLLFSLLFYGWGEPVYLFIMLFSIIINYAFGVGIHKSAENQKRKKALLTVAVVVNVLLLGVFKYTDFVIGTVNALAGASLPGANIALPIGISFFTFQAMSYVFDVYRGTAQVQKNILSFGLYISLFPQLIAGPIVRYSTVAAEINSRKSTGELTASGIKRFLTGLGKKVLLANNIGMLWDTLSQREDLPMSAAWLGAFAFAFQIYFDFSGYSDMAIGLGRIFGFHFLENFNYPYISSSITDFWRRWHISLGTWFKEYVYIPLGGNRKGKLRQVRNILIVWLLTGLWHGASWNFVLWGLYYGLCLLGEKLIPKSFFQKMPRVLRHLYSILLILFGWVIFAFQDMSSVAAYFMSMLGANGISDGGFLKILAPNAVLLVILFFASTPFPAWLGNKIEKRLGKSGWIFELLWYLGVGVLSVAYLVNSTYNPFIYFRF